MINTYVSYNEHSFCKLLHYSLLFHLNFRFWYFFRCIICAGYHCTSRVLHFAYKYKFEFCLYCLVGSALRVLPAETRLTVYRRFEIIPVQCSRQVQSSSAYPRKPPLWMRICFQKFCPNENSLTQNVDIYIKFRLRGISLKMAIKTQEIYWRQWFSNIINTLIFLYFFYIFEVKFKKIYINWIILMFLLSLD